MYVLNPLLWGFPFYSNVCLVAHDRIATSFLNVLLTTDSVPFNLQCYLCNNSHELHGYKTEHCIQCEVGYTKLTVCMDLWKHLSFSVVVFPHHFGEKMNFSNKFCHYF